MPFEVYPEEITAGATALWDEKCICDVGTNEWGSYHLMDPECLICNDNEGMVKAILKAVIPLIGNRLAAAAEEEACRMITAMVASNGGRVAIPLNVYEATRGAELTRYDDLSTNSIVFETPTPDVA